MEILEAFDLVGTLRKAAELANCDHKTVAHYVAQREAAGGDWRAGRRPCPRTDPHAEKIAEWVDRSQGKVRADKVHERLEAMGYRGAERTTRRAVARAKAAWRAGHGRITRPWVPEPGLWLQWDYGEGPIIDGRATSLFCAWLAFSRYRVVLPLVDRTLPSMVMALDRALRAFGGAPTYALTDNEKTVTVDHVCGIAVRNPKIVAASRHYGLTVEGACEAFCERVNAREHRVTGRAPIEMLQEERERLHPLPASPTRSVSGRRARSPARRRSRSAARSTRSPTSWWASGSGRASPTSS